MTSHIKQLERIECEGTLPLRAHLGLPMSSLLSNSLHSFLFGSLAQRRFGCNSILLLLN